MYHVISVGMNSDLLGKLDELRQAFPGAAERRQIVQQLILEAHARLVSPGPAEAASNVVRLEALRPAA
jgi:hypothetical protein